MIRRRWLAGGLAAFALHATVGTAHATFAEEPGSPFPAGSDPAALLAPDLDGDGRPDAAVVNGSDSNVSVLLRQPGGGFAEELGSPFAGGDSFAATADFNGDTRPDIAVAGFATASVTVLLRRAGGGFDTETTPAGGRAGAIAAADFNADGRPDLAVGDWDGGVVRILLRQPAGGFSVEGAPIATGTNPRSIAVADFNTDGRPDLAVANQGSGTVSVLLRKATSGFAAEPESPIAVGAQPFVVIADDFDANGSPDLALTNAGPQTVTILLRRASGSGFSPEPGSPIVVGGAPRGIAAGDFDGDGRRDLAFASNAAGTVTVLLRGAGGGFAPEPSSPISVGPGPSAVAVADFNVDGRPDIATTNALDSLSVHLNTTERRSTGPGPSPVTPQPQSPAARAPSIGGIRLASSTIRARGGLRVSLRLSAAATLRATITRRVRGRRVGRRCAPRAKRGRRCTTVKTVRRLNLGTLAAGARTVKVNTRGLKPGRYRLTLTASAAGLTGKPVSLSFRVTRPSARRPGR